MSIRYAIDYPKNRYESKSDACEGVVVDYLYDYIPISLMDYINYEGVVDMLDIDIIEQDDKFVVLSETPFEDLEL